MKKLLCPICKEELVIEQRSYKCQNKHTFDISKHNYINFLTYGKSHGDNKEMIAARRDFLESGFYSPLKDALKKEISDLGTDLSLLDAGCGEGYYTEAIAPFINKQESWAIDVSKDALIFASKRIKDLNYAVGSVYDMPFFADHSFDLITSIFSPFAKEEFLRLLKKDGYLISIIPGKTHLFGIKKIIYDNPYENSVKPFEEEGLEFFKSTNVNYTVQLSPNEALTLWKMTPYYYRTPKSGIERLIGCKNISTDVSFHIIVYKPKG